MIFQEIGNEKLIVKSKSNVTEEIELTSALESQGVERAGREDAKPRPPLLEINNVYGMLRAVESGFGIASVPDYMARESPHLVKVLPDLPGPSFEVYFIYPSDLKRSKRIAAFRQFLIDQSEDWKT